MNNFQQQEAGSEISNSEMSDCAARTLRERNETYIQDSPSPEDENIIRHFVKGDKKFVYNQNLQIEPQINVVTLKERQGKILGVIKINCKNNSALIRYKSEYLDLIHKILTENNFVGIGDSKKQPGFIEYQQYEVPTGYKINYTTPKLLWKTWWPCQRFNSRHNIQLNILLLIKEKWYPIKDIIVQEGTFTIKTLVKEIALSSTDKIVWINKVNQQQENSSIAVSERCEAIQNFIVNQETSNNHQLENNSNRHLSPDNGELLRHLGYIEENLKQVSVVQQNEILALQRKHSEEINSLRQQMLSLQQKISQLEMSRAPETSKFMPPIPGDEPLEAQSKTNIPDATNNSLLQNLARVLQRRS